MIILDNTGRITVQLPQITDVTNYTILLQNTVTKDIHKFDVEGENDVIYRHFDINTSNLIDGEYYLVLIANPYNSVIEVTNDIKNYEVNNVVYYLVNDGDYITDGNLYVGISGDPGVSICTRELVRKGEFENKATQYNKNNKYVTYKG